MIHLVLNYRPDHNSIRGLLGRVCGSVCGVSVRTAILTQ